MRRDAGTVTIWTMAMMLGVALLGWLSLSVWAVFAERRDLAAAADQAAQSGATALDIDEFRATGITQLDPDLAELARQAAVRFLDLVRFCVLFDAKYLVIIFFRHFKSGTSVK